LFARIVLALSALVFVLSCGTISTGPSSSMTVATLNLEGGGRHLGESEQETAQRYFRIAHQYFMPAEGLWNLVGLTELRYRRDQPNSLSHVALESLQFNCGPYAGNTVGYGADCFGKHTHAVVAKTDRGLGYNANFEFELIPDSFRNSHIGEQRATIIHRTVMGARFRARYWDGIVVPFYVVHISSTGDEDRQRAELRDLIDLLHSWYVPGDMPPVVVGDFNCHNWTQSLQQLILNEFADVTAGLNEVMRILVSRPQHYPSAALRWQSPHSGDARLHDLGGTAYTDHSAVAATLRVDRTGSSGLSWPPPTAPADKLVPDPFSPSGLKIVRANCPTTVD